MKREIGDYIQDVIDATVYDIAKFNEKGFGGDRFIKQSKKVALYG